MTNRSAAPFGAASASDVARKPRSFSTVEQLLLHSNLKSKTTPRERKRGKISVRRCSHSRLYIQTDNPFVVVKRKEVINNNNNIDTDGHGDKISNDHEEEEKHDMVNELNSFRQQQGENVSI